MNYWQIFKLFNSTKFVKIIFSFSYMKYCRCYVFDNSIYMLICIHLPCCRKALHGVPLWTRWNDVCIYSWDHFGSVWFKSLTATSPTCFLDYIFCVIQINLKRNRLTDGKCYDFWFGIVWKIYEIERSYVSSVRITRFK